MNCNLCGSGKKEKICKLCSNMQILGTFFPNEETDVVVCKKCGNVYVDVNATQEDYNNYYKSDSAHSLSYYEVYGKEQANKYFSDILNVFDKYINANSEIVDIASGVGDFSVFLKEKGYKNVSALDISDRCIKLLQEKNINAIKSDTIDCAEKYENTFDLAVFVHSLEHYLDFKSAILSAKKMLKKDGYLYIEVPDASKYCDIDAVPYTMFTLEHTFHLTLDTIDNIARVCGLTLIDKNSFYKANSYHVLYGLFKNNGKIEEAIYSSCAKDAVKKYSRFCAEKIKPSIEKYEKTQEKLILWGVGASTALLLNENFDNCNVISLIDRNPARQGLSYKIGSKELLIEDPSTIKDEEATIVILPYWYKDSIAKQIEEMGFKNKISSL